MGETKGLEPGMTGGALPWAWRVAETMKLAAQEDGEQMQAQFPFQMCLSLSKLLRRKRLDPGADKWCLMFNITVISFFGPVLCTGIISLV